jgi:hypothetical protein
MSDEDLLLLINKCNTSLNMVEKDKITQQISDIKAEIERRVSGANRNNS